MYFIVSTVWNKKVYNKDIHALIFTENVIIRSIIYASFLTCYGNMYVG